MSLLNGATILNDAQTMIQDQGVPLRAKMLVWLNVAAQELATMRPWLFLKASVTATPVNNQITKPLNYGEFDYLNLPTMAVFDDRNKLTPGEAFQADNTSVGYAFPIGYTEENTTITLHGASWSVPTTLGYIIEPPAITDDITDTVWPSKARSYFMRRILTMYYEMDMDERKQQSDINDMQEVRELKAWDNNQKPKTQNNRHGYRRTR